ncbi:sigma-70 family RNA polymerase sigma factor [Leuconostocaceae bacterium ESL0958]|nr:sigma-70 family RNA polymerase sigma factor [Leuconostocaceae bacterium ESL0958]
MEDRLAAVVRAAQNGQECAYLVLIAHLRKLMMSVYNKNVPKKVREDDWYAEALDVLVSCVNRFETRSARAKFSTYYTTALKHRAIDFVRAQHSHKSEFMQQMIFADAGDEQGYLIGSNQDNPEAIYLVKDTLERMVLSDTDDFRRTIRFFIGKGPLLSQPGDSNRKVDQVQYRFKRDLKKALQQRLLEKGEEEC